MANDGWYDGAKRLPITTTEFYPTRAVPLVSIVDHVTAGSDSRDWLQNANNSSSVHFLIRMEGGKAVVYQFMSVNRGAWGNGRHSGVNTPHMPQWVKDLINRGVNINHATVSIEHEKVTPFNNDMPAPMLEATIALHKWLIANYPTIKPTRKFIIGHYAIDATNRAFCPGGKDGKGFPFAAILQALQGAPQPPQPPVGNGTAIEAYHDATGGFAQYGNPLEVDSAGRVKERTIKLPDVVGEPFQVGFYQKGVIVWRRDVGASRYNSGAWLLNTLVRHGEV